MQDDKFYKLVPATVTFLEMHHRPATSLPIREQTTFSILQKPIAREEYRRYYGEVGQQYYWLDRIYMDNDELSKKINDDKVDIFLMHVNNDLAGFAEFVREPDFTEILYFGLFPAFVGKGWGHFFLQWVIGQAWSYDPKWIQLNTCSLDHPNALPMYKKAGFAVVRTEVQERKAPLNHQSGKPSST